MAYTSDGDADFGNGASDGPRKKQRIDGPRPMCTNCEQCQLRKGKCDGGRPICGWCAANNKACVYQEKKKPGLKAGYGRDLERRLSTLEETTSGREAELERKILLLEERLESHSQLLEQLNHHRPQQNGQRSPMAVGGANYGITTASPAASAHPSNQSHHSTHSVAAPSPYQHHPHRPGPGMFASPAASAQLSLQNFSEFPAQPGSLTSHASLHRSQSSQQMVPSASPAVVSRLSLDDQELPPLDLAYDLLELYFDRINPWFPLLDRKSTMNKIFRDPGPDDVILLHGIIATTIRFYDSSTQKVYRPEYMQRQAEFHEVSKQKVILRSFETPSIRGLQALVILCLDMVGSQNGGPGMFILASIARCATQLGLTSETFSLSTSPDYPSISTLRASVLSEPKDFVEDEMRRRLFWLIYILDRDTTVATAFDFVLDDSIIDRKLPCKDELFSANQPVETRWFSTSRRTDYSIDYPANLGAFAYLIELKGLLTKIHHFLKRPVNINAHADVEQWRRTYREIDCNLRNWRSSLPFELRNTDQVLNLGDGGQPMTSSWVLLQVTYYTVFIRMHSSAAYPPYRTPIFTPSYSASQQCYQAVEKIVAIAKYVTKNSMLSQQGPPFAFSLWVSARVHLVHGSTVEKFVSGEIHFLISTLQQMGQHWRVAARYAQILQKVMSEYQESQSSAAAAAASGAIAPQPPSVAILADMRRCAYDLDTLISNEPLRERNEHGNGVGPSNGAHLANGSAHGAAAINGNAAGTEKAGTPLLTDMDYLETFNFFNYPRLPTAIGPGDAGAFNAYYSVPSDAASQASMGVFGVPDINSDWLSTHFT